LERGGAPAAFSPGKGAVAMLMEPTSLNRGEEIISRVGGIVFQRWEGGGCGNTSTSQCVAKQKEEETLLTWALLFCCQ